MGTSLHLPRHPGLTSPRLAERKLGRGVPEELEENEATVFPHLFWSPLPLAPLLSRSRGAESPNEEAVQTPCPFHLPPPPRPPRGDNAHTRFRAPPRGACVCVDGGNEGRMYVVSRGKPSRAEEEGQVVSAHEPEAADSARPGGKGCRSLERGILPGQVGRGERPVSAQVTAC